MVLQSFFDHFLNFEGWKCLNCGKIIVKKETPTDIAERINFWLKTDREEKNRASEKLQKYVLEKHSLNALIEKFFKEIKA